MARGVDDVDLVLGVAFAPVAGGRSRGDRDATLLFLLHPVHGGAAIVNFTDLVVDAGVVQNALGRGRLAGIDVRHDADVAELVEGMSCHGCLVCKAVVGGGNVGSRPAESLARAQVDLDGRQGRHPAGISYQR